MSGSAAAPGNVAVAAASNTAGPDAGARSALQHSMQTALRTLAPAGGRVSGSGHDNDLGFVENKRALLTAKEPCQKKKSPVKSKRAILRALIGIPEDVENSKVCSIRQQSIGEKASTTRDVATPVCEPIAFYSDVKSQP